MTITYPLAFPSTLKIKTITPTLKFVNAMSRSPFTFERQNFRWPGEMWGFDCNMIPMTREDAEEWIAFAIKLRGTYGTFLFGDASAATPRGIGGGSPVVDGGGQAIGSYELNVRGVPSAVVGWLLKGDYFQIGTGSTARLHKLTADADTQSGGEVTLEFAPALRFSPADNAPLVITSAKGVFALVDNSVTWAVDENGHYRYSFAAEEAL